MSGATDDADDAHAVRDAMHVVHGPQGDPAKRELAFAAYIGVLIGGLYAFPLIRALMVTADKAGTIALIRSPWMLVAALVATAVVLLLAAEIGRVRGPVVPPLPWIDGVVGAPVDRWLALRSWFTLSMLGVLYAGVLGGAIVGASFVGAGAGPVVVIPLGAGVGLVCGGAVGVMWLVGQSRIGSSVGGRLPRVTGTPWAAEVRSLGVHDLRTQSARSDRIIGGVFVADLRAIRLEAARPVRRGRTIRLRPSGPLLGYVRRDLVGLRRAPVDVIVWLVLSSAGAVGLAATHADEAVPALLAVVAAAGCFWGCGALAEGLRLEADTMGTPVLFGGSPLRAALAHLIVPGVGIGSVVAVLATVVSTWAAAPVLAVLGWCLLTALAVIGGQLCAAYRGQYRPRFAVRVSLPAAAAFHLWPLGVVVVHAGAIAWALDRWGATPVVVVGAVLVPLVLFAVGLGRVRTLSLEHRDV